MTEQEFLRQVWRPLDTVTVDGGIKGRVISVCFPKRSVRDYFFEKYNLRKE